MTVTTNTAGWLELKVPPAVQLVITAAAMFAIARWTADLGLDRDLRIWLYRGLTLLGAGVVILGWWDFRRARTTVDPTRPHKASALVENGIYRFTRNPMYLGFLVILLGWAAFLDNGYSLLAVPLFAAYIGRFQIRPEEKALGAAFGSTYEAYCKRVRRWV